MKSSILLLGVLFCYLNSSVAQEITFSNQIAPIIFEKCTPCHQKGQIAPMPFTNYQEVAAYASMIKYVTGIKYMPPWKPINSNQHFKNERQLSEEEINLIQLWVDNGIAEGKPLQGTSNFDDPEILKIDSPDAIISMSEAFEQYGVYYDQYRVFVLPTNFGEDKIVSEIEFVPGNKSIVRSCFISIDNSEKVVPLDEWDPQYGYYSFGELGFVPNQSRWYTWQPLKGATIFKNENGKYLPKNAKLLLHIHYGPTGVPQNDSSFVKLKFSNKKPKKVSQNIPLIHPYMLTNPPFQIPAGETIRYHAKFEIPFDVTLNAIMPHSHLLGRKWEIFTVDPKGINSQVLLKITDWDFKWKQQYEFEQPIMLEAGTVIHALAEYDNTLDNLLNPSDPPKPMTLGKRMYEEMFLVYFELLTPYVSNDSNVKIVANPTLISSEESIFNIEVSSPIKLSAAIKNFSNEVVRDIFQNKSFAHGVHSFNTSLNELEKGNYFLELTNTEGQAIAQSIFVYVDQELFE